MGIARSSCRVLPAFTAVLILLAAKPAQAVTYTTVPPAVTAGYASNLTLTINRSLDAGDEGFSDDEMNTFAWYGPSNPFPTGRPVVLPKALMQDLTQVKVVIASNLLTVVGNVTITYLADPNASRQLRTISFNIVPPPQIVTMSMPNLRLGHEYFRENGVGIQATGGIATFTWSVAAGAFPPGLRYDNSYANPVPIVGTPTTVGSFPFTARITDVFNISAQKAFTIAVSAPPRISPPDTLPPGAVGTRYFVALQSTGGQAPLRWSLIARELPPGLTLDSSSGILTGTPTTPGTYSFEVRLDDALTATYRDEDRKTLIVVISGPLQITTNALPSGVRGANYSFALQATGGVTPYQWALASGSLPPGLTLSSSGVIGGTPTAAGTFNITVRASDPNGSVQKAFTLTIDEAGGVGPFTSLHGATFQSGTSAPDAIVAGFGANLAPGNAATTSASLPGSLLNITVNVKDSAGRESPAPLFFVSPGQINYVVPSGLALGGGAVTVKNGTQPIASGSLQIDQVAPGFFTANANGTGVASALLIRVKPDLSQISSLVYECGTAPGSCVPVPLDMGLDNYYLLLFGTGIRGRSSLTAVTATVGGEMVGVTYAGAQNEYPGLDQVNLGPLPRTLLGRGTVEVVVKMDGKEANHVTVAFTH